MENAPDEDQDENAHTGSAAGPGPDSQAAPAAALSEQGRLEIERQRTVCAELLARWLPLATADTLALRKDGRAGPVIDEDAFDAGLKAGAFVLKILERLSRLDAAQAESDNEASSEGSPALDPQELAARWHKVKPLLAARLAEAKTADAKRRQG